MNINFALLHYCVILLLRIGTAKYPFKEQWSPPHPFLAPLPQPSHQFLD